MWFLCICALQQTNTKKTFSHQNKRKCEAQKFRMKERIHWCWMKNNTLFFTFHIAHLIYGVIKRNTFLSFLKAQTNLRIHTQYVQICGIPMELKNARCNAIVYIWSIHNFKAILLDECEWMCISHIFFCWTLVRWSLTVRIVFTATYLCFCSSSFFLQISFIPQFEFICNFECLCSNSIKRSDDVYCSDKHTIFYFFSVHTRQTLHQWLVSVSISVWIFNSKTDCLPF